METEYFTIVKDTVDRISFFDLVSPSYLKQYLAKGSKFRMDLIYKKQSVFNLKRCIYFDFEADTIIRREEISAKLN